VEKYYIVYKTTNKINGKFYVGSHQTTEIEDGYLGSGKVLKLAIKKYGRVNFQRDIICLCSSSKAMREVEAHFVRYYITKYKRFCYNRSYSGTGAMLGEDNSFFGKKHSEATRKILSDKSKLRVGELNPFYGRKHTQDTIAKINTSRPNTDNCPNMLKYYLEKQEGWWCTPLGCFYSARYASQITGIPKATLMSRCKKSECVVKPNYQIPEDFHNKTWRENGFYYLEKYK
jgi:group I intron endonuclease